MHVMQRVTLVAVAASALAADPAVAGVAAAQNHSGEYVLTADGHTVLALDLKQKANGRLDGSVTAAGKSLPITGGVRQGKLAFTSAAPDGGLLHWEAVPQGADLAVSLIPPGADGRPDTSLAQRYTLTRQAAGGSAALLQSSLHWVTALIAVTDSVMSWCAQPWLAKKKMCREAVKVHEKIAPALMISRFATGGVTALAKMHRPALVGATANGAVESGGAAPAGHSAPLLAARSGGAPRADTAAPPPTSLLRSLVAKSPAAGVAGDYVMVHDGAEVLTVRLTADGERVAGSVSAGGVSLPLAGTAASGAIEFTTTSPDGQAGRWRGSLEGDRLTLTLTASGGTERYVLTRRAAK